MITATETKKTPNAKQQQCINNIHGKYLVLAGPGTGKTFTVIERIKNMISQGIDSEKILCLTYTDAAANEMKKRIEDELNIVSCGVQIFTYHGFCCSVIEEYPDEFDLPAGYRVIPDSVSKSFIKDCIDEIKPVYFRTDKNDPYFFINKIKTMIGSIKQNRLTKEKYFINLNNNHDWEPEKLKISLDIDKKIKEGKDTSKLEDNLKSIEKKINQAKELWTFYELYQDKMAKESYLDFNDMINIVLEKFEKSPGFLNQVANKYEYIMVDEYQDTNKSQNAIVFTLAHALETENIFVVGDDDQIIYRFQGANLKTISNFLEEFKDTKVICLTDNMRSTQEILDAARAVIAQDPLSLMNTHSIKDMDENLINKNLTAKNEEVIAKSKPVRFYKYADIMQEYTEIVNEIDEIINSDECPRDKATGEKLYSQIAVLTRTNAEAQDFAELFKQRNIPYELKDGKDIFKISAVNALYFYIQFLINPEMNSFRVFQLLTAPPFSIHPKDYQILYNSISKDKTFIDVLRYEKLEGLSDNEKFTEFLKTYDYLTEYKTKESIKNTILEIGRKTGIFDYYINTDINRTESIAGLKTFLDEAEGFSEIHRSNFLEEFCEYLKALLSDEEQLTTEKVPVNMNAVQLCTYHSSKGREFEYVYMPTLINSKWESNTKPLTPSIPLDASEWKSKEQIKAEDKPSDLAKLMYVAMTRAKHTLRLSYPEMIDGKAKKPTKFLFSIQDMFEREPIPFEYNEINYWEQAKNLLVKNEYDYIKEFNEFIDLKLNNRAHSPSSINTYLNCPRQYLYERVLELTTKDANNNLMSYGSAVHKTLENSINYIKDNGTPPDKAQVIAWFKESLLKQHLESWDHRDIIEGRGINALNKYYAQITNTTPTSLYETEYKLEYTMNDGTKFIGYIDRIDKNPDGTYTIYDYKTGDNKNSKIKVGGDKENYYNQMAWYKYFYEQQTGNKVSLTKFIYPEDFEKTNNGIQYTEQEIEDAVGKFRQAVSDIKEHKFEKNEKANCQYCSCKDYCGMNVL